MRNIRIIDSVGRIVIPVNIRNSLEIRPGDDIELFVGEEQIVLRKHTRPCIFCGQTDDVIEYKSRIICDTCMISLKCYDQLKHLY